ncbi:MAG: MlaD family protein [Chthoniobacter sp.]|nr:MlaD family protein [Chthoniobacter sp.]
MNAEGHKTEFLVGLFVLIGLTFIAAMVIIFGRVGQGFEKTYLITVEFPDGSGLVKGCDVMLSGAKVGTLTEAPRLVGGEDYVVAAPLKIREDVKIPKHALFVIRTRGMLGDAFVHVVPPETYTPKDFLQPGDTVAGSRAAGLDQIMDTVKGEVLPKVTAELDELNKATKSINERLLAEQNMKNLEETLASLKASSAGFAQASKNLDPVVAKAGEAVDSAKTALKSMDGAVSDARVTLGDYRKVADSANALIKKATTGDGTLGTLISDKQSAENFRALVANLRRSGVLFYKDRTLPGPAPAATPPPASARPRVR